MAANESHFAHSAEPSKQFFHEITALLSSSLHWSIAVQVSFLLFCMSVIKQHVALRD